MFFLLFAQCIVFGQQLDSTLKSELDSSELTPDQRILSGIKLTESWLRKDNNYALNVAEDVYGISLSIDDTLYRIKGLLNFGKALEWTQQYKTAKEYYSKAKKSAQIIGADSLLIDAYCGLGHTHYLLHELDSAAQYYIAAVKLVETGTNDAKKAEVYVQLAEYYRSLPRYDLALQYLDKTQNLLKTQTVSVETEIEMYSRYAAVWNEMNTKTDSAIYYSELCIELGEKINDLHVVATSHNELSAIKQKQGDPSFEEHSLKAIEIWRSMNYLAYEGRAMYNLMQSTSNSSTHNGRTKVEMLEDFLLRANDKDLPILKQDFYHLLAAEYERIGEPQKALQALKVYTEIVRVNTLNQQQRALNEAQEKFEAEKHLRIISEQENNLKLATEEKLREQEMRKQQETESRNYLILSVALLLVVIVVVVLIVRSKKQNHFLQLQEEKTKSINLKLEKALGEKELLLKEIHHRVKNNLQIVVGLLELQSFRIDSDPVKKALLESINRVRSMSLVHQKLYMNDDLGKIDVHDYVESLVREIEFANNKHQLKLKKEIVIPELIFDIDTIIPLGLILNELLTNSFKYAFESQEASVSIVIQKGQDGEYSLIYTDSGPGLPDDFEISKSSSLGMRLVQQLSRQLNGKVTYSREGGAKFLVTFEDSGARKKTA